MKAQFFKLLVRFLQEWHTIRLKGREKEIRSLKMEEVRIQCDIRVKKVELSQVREQLKLLLYEPETERAVEPAKIETVDTEEPRQIRNY